MPVGEGLQRLGVLQVADVLGDEPRARPWPGRTCSSARRRRPAPAAGTAACTRQRLRRVAAGPPQHRLPAAERPHHRVVGPDVDRPGREQERVGDAGQPRQRVRRPGRRSAHRRRCRWSARSAGRPRASSRWCSGVYGSISAELPVARRDRSARSRPQPAVAGSSTIGRRGLVSSRAAVSSTSHSRRGRREVGHHHRERLVLAVLARPQRRGRRLVPGVDGQVVAAEALDREHPARPAAGRPRRRAGHRPVRSRRASHEPEPRPARRAAHGLGVEPAVGRIVVLGRARGAHGEAAHRRQRPVVGHVPHDREPRPAVGAVDERVAEPAVGRVGQLAPGSRRRSRCRPTPASVPLSARHCSARSRTPAEPVGPQLAVVTRSILASGGACCSSRQQELRDRLRRRPRPRRTRRPTSLPTRPDSPRLVASEYTNGRKPTPWTTPATRTAVRTTRSLTPPV